MEIDEILAHSEQILDNTGTVGRLFAVGDGKCLMMSESRWPAGETTQDCDGFFGYHAVV
jgi:hypothetical protein